MKQKSGFTLIQLSVILTVASLIFVATLPGVQTSLKSNAASVTKMNSILNTMRGYMAANGYLPCPADPTQAIGASNYGAAAANPGTANNCTGGTPAAAYADTTNHIAIGMVPVKALGLSYADALDGFGRDITYAVDTNATATCWSSSSLTGAITVNDNGINYNTIAVLVSHGADGYGAWLPLSGTSGSASRFNNGSTDTSQAANAQVATGGGLTANTTFVSFVNKAATSTFDDNIVYKSNLYTLNNLPTSAQVYPSVTPPSNGTYSSGQVLTFTLTYASNVTVTGTPRLDLSALGSGSIGTGNVAYATYQSGSGTTALTFSYTVQGTDSAPTSGIAVTGAVDLNGGTLSGGSTCFTAPSLTGVLIGTSSYYRTVTIDHTKVPNTDRTNFPVLFSGTYTYLKTVANGGTVTNASGYDIYFTSDSAGQHLLPFERESWSASTGASVFWVQVPTVSHTADTVIYLQYANSGITTDQSNKTGTWDSNFKAVYHLNGALTDSTSNGGSLTNGGSTSVAGYIANGQNFVRASSQYAYTTTNPMTVTNNFTMSAWVYLNTISSAEYTLVENGYANGGGTGYALTFKGNNFKALIDSGSGIFEDSNFSPSATTWYHFVFTRNAGTGQIYINGTAQGATFSDTPATPSTNFSLGARSAGTEPPTLYFADAIVDEVRLSTTPRSADWIKTEYNNQSSPSTFYTVGAQTSR